LEIVVENTNKYVDTEFVNYSDCDKYKVKKDKIIGNKSLYCSTLRVRGWGVQVKQAKSG
jgi:hypothetical protein